MKLLYGFSDTEVQKRIEKSMRERGYEPETVCVCGKVNILSYLEQHPEIETCIFTEVMQDGSSFNSMDLTRITDERDINIIIVLDIERKGSEFVRQLYAGGILNGLFVNSSIKNSGVSVPDIVDLIMEPRNRKVAKIYYGISNEAVEDINKLSRDKIQEYIRFLSNEGDYTDIGERYIKVVTSLTRNQNIDFFGRLPIATREAILSSPEYVRAKAAIESTPGEVVVVMKSAQNKKKRKKGELKKLDDVANVAKQLPVSGQIDTAEYVDNILRPFMDNRNVISTAQHKKISGDMLHQMRYDMSKITGVAYRIPEKKIQHIEQKEEVHEQAAGRAEQTETSNGTANAASRQVKKIVPKKITVSGQNKAEKSVIDSTGAGEPKKTYKIKKIK